MILDLGSTDVADSCRKRGGSHRLYSADPVAIRSPLTVPHPVLAISSLQLDHDPWNLASYLRMKWTRMEIT